MKSTPSTQRFAPSSLVGAALVATLALLAMPFPPSVLAQQGPKAVVPKTEHDFGEVARGQTFRTEFVIENQGDAPLELRDVRAACACTVVDMPEAIAPGESGSIEIALDTTPLDGASSKGVAVFTNDDAAPRIDFTIKVDARPFLVAKPGYVRYIVVQGFEEDSTLLQKIWEREGADFEITAVESPTPGIQASWRPLTEEERDPDIPGPQWGVETKVDPWAPVGPLSGYLRIQTNHPKQKTIPVPVSGFVRPVFATTPSQANFGTVDPGGAEPIVGSVKVQNFATEEIGLGEIGIDIDGITTDVEVEKEGRIYYVVLKLSPDMPKGPFSGTLEIQTRSERAPAIKVPVSGTVE